MNMCIDEFEAWYSGIDGHGDAHKKDMLEAWKASRAALCVELPRVIFCDDENQSLGYITAIDDTKECLDSAGVSYK